ncbi:MAG: hypothetical protein PHO02_02085 [Candidatus Nanoarchaeia archaeon]|nr:hypothetical protein [Candidatus Nanoarchaeia archaeon]
MPFYEKLRRIKYPLAAVLAAGLIGTGVFAGASCNTKSQDNPPQTGSIEPYRQALEKLAECETYLLDEKYEKASECNDSFALIEQESSEYRQSISSLSERFSNRLQDSIESKYNLMLKQAEAELSLDNYSYALELSNRAENELEKLDFFEKQNEMLAKSNELERKINDEKSNNTADFSYIEHYYGRIKQLYLLLGFGQPLSDIAAALTILLPVYGVVRRMRKRFV